MDIHRIVERFPIRDPFHCTSHCFDFYEQSGSRIFFLFVFQAISKRLSGLDHLFSSFLKFLTCELLSIFSFSCSAFLPFLRSVSFRSGQDFFLFILDDSALFLLDFPGFFHPGFLLNDWSWITSFLHPSFVLSLNPFQALAFDFRFFGFPVSLSGFPSPAFLPACISFCFLLFFRSFFRLPVRRIGFYFGFQLLDHFSFSVFFNSLEWYVFSVFFFPFWENNGFTIRFRISVPCCWILFNQSFLMKLFCFAALAVCLSVRTGFLAPSRPALPVAFVYSPKTSFPSVSHLVNLFPGKLYFFKS